MNSMWELPVPMPVKMGRGRALRASLVTSVDQPATPNDIRHFVHKRLIRAAVGLVPGGSTALAIGSALAGGRGGRGGRAALRNLGLTDSRRREITRAMQAATARGDTTTAGKFLVELGIQGPLGPRAPSTALTRQPRTAVLANLGLTDARRREITKAMRAATARGDAATASAFLRELGTQGPLRPPSVPPVNPVRLAVIQAKPMADVPNLQPRARDRIPQVSPIPQPIGAPTMAIHRTTRRLLGLIRPGGDECPPGSFPSPAGCVDPSAILPGGDPFIGAGAPVMGRYGAAYQGTSRLVQRTTCLPGDLVGDDGLCYSRGSLTNRQRMWPKGRRPLLTGGEMRAISIASRAAGRLERTQKRLQKMGMIKKAAPRPRQRPLPAPHVHQITSGGS